MTDYEKKKAIEIIVRYREIENLVSKLQLDIESITKEKTKLLNKLKGVEVEESVFLETLRKKYGKEKININEILKEITYDNNGYTSGIN
jgi:predicted  nucleic acid-binding Zn-ribbon protein